MSTVTKEQVQERVIEALASFGPDASQITPQASFEELDIDSLDLVELAQIVEDEYGVVLKGEDMKELKTVGDAVDLIAARAEAGSAPSNPARTISSSATGPPKERRAARVLARSFRERASSASRAERPTLQGSSRTGGRV